MKKYRISKSTLCMLFAVVFILFSAVTAFAVDIDGDGIDDGDVVETEGYTDWQDVTDEVYTEPETDPITEPTEPYTEYATEYYTEEATEEYTQPVYTEEPTEPEDGYIEETTEYDFNNNVVNETVSPTQLSTSKISTKRYETNNFAGVVSWVCVIVGIVVLVFVLLGTKISYMLEKRRAQRDIYSS